MKVREAVAKYLAHQRDVLRLEESAVGTVRHALLVVLNSVLGDPLGTLTAERVAHLRGELADQRGIGSDALLLDFTQRMYLATAVVFLRFCTEQGWAAADLATALATRGPAGDRPLHAGELARRLREAAGLTRRQLATGVGIPHECIQSFEAGRYRPTPWMLRRLLRAPAMAGLLEWTEREGLTIEVAADPPQGEPS